MVYRRAIDTTTANKKPKWLVVLSPLCCEASRAEQHLSAERTERASTPNDDHDDSQQEVVKQAYSSSSSSSLAAPWTRK